MQQKDPAVIFDQAHAEQYDERFARLAPLRDSLHLLVGAVFSDQPADARILCIGAGTGAELIYLAGKFPRWRFTAVEPSEPMLNVCRRRAEELGLAPRCVFHHGYLDSLPPSEAFDAATSLLSSLQIAGQASSGPSRSGSDPEDVSPAPIWHPIPRLRLMKAFSPSGCG